MRRVEGPAEAGKASLLWRIHMPSILGSLRQTVLAPRLSAVTFAGRGFPGAASPAAERLEAIPQAVVCGFEWGIAGSCLWEVERRLELVDAEQKGFAYEGAAMAFAIRDAMTGGRGTRTRELLFGPAAPHLLLTYIGIGFAMARLPRRFWGSIIPDLTGSPYFPTMTWLAVDGYGFDLAYFHTDKYVDQQQVPPAYPWQDAPEYFPHAVDQGIGRALWFIHGADPAAVVAAVDRFPADRRPDLWSGVGLAATFAGGCPADGLSALRVSAGEHWSQLALGVVFAIKGRDLAGHLPAHSALAAEELAGLSVPGAVAIADRTEAESHGHDPVLDGVPLYERWRSRIRTHLTTAEHVNSGIRRGD
jgi:enediyne biosynthesis protein E2